jgi:hypothetical protein
MPNNLKKVCIKAKIPPIMKVFFDFLGSERQIFVSLQKVMTITVTTNTILQGL